MCENSEFISSPWSFGHYQKAVLMIRFNDDQSFDVIDMGWEEH